MENETDFFKFCVRKIETRGFFDCRDSKFADMLYNHLKPKHPTLYKYQDGNSFYVEILEMKHINDLLDRRTLIENELMEIDSILHELAKDHIDLSSDLNWMKRVKKESV